MFPELKNFVQLKLELLTEKRIVNRATGEQRDNFFQLFLSIFLFLARRQGNVRHKYLEMVKRISFQLDFEAIHQQRSAGMAGGKTKVRCNFGILTLHRSPKAIFLGQQLLE